MRLDDLALVGLQQRDQRAVQDAGPAVDRQRRAVATGLEALAGGLDAEQRDARRRRRTP